MIQSNEKVVKKGTFEGMAYSSAKRYACEKGTLTLTTKNLMIDCEGKWSKTFPISDIHLSALNNNLELRDWYGKLWFRLIIDEAMEWQEAFDKAQHEEMNESIIRASEWEKKAPMELKKLLDIEPETLEKLYHDLQKERMQFEKKNIRFNLEIQMLYLKVKNRKLRAFIVAHSYVAWYEWTKRLLRKIYKAKFGKGPVNDKELIDFLDDYPSWKGALDTTKWEIRANQIRNCVSHEKFYFDYKNSELVFMAKREKRVRLRELRSEIYSLSHFYGILLRSLEEKVTKGEISHTQFS
jgi:hypothetical protein